MINVKILTGYPEMFPGGLAHSLMGKALKENIFKLETINLHDFGVDNFGAGDLLETIYKNKKIYIPLDDNVLSVDLEKKIILVDPIKGIIDND